MIHTRFRFMRLAAAVAGVALAGVSAVPAQAASVPTPSPSEIPGAQAAQAAAVAIGGVQRSRVQGALEKCGTILTHVDSRNVMRTVAIEDLNAAQVSGSFQLPFAPVAMTTFSATDPVGSTFRNVMIGADSRGHLFAVRITRNFTGGTTTATVTPMKPSIAGISEMYASGPYLYLRAGTQFVRWTVNSAVTGLTGGVQIGSGKWSSVRAIHGVLTIGSGANAKDVTRAINASTGALMDMKLHRKPTSAPVELKATPRTGFGQFTKLYQGACATMAKVSMYGVKADNTVALYLDSAPLDATAKGVKYVTTVATGLVGGRMFS